MASKTRGEGRTAAEKAQGLWATKESKKERRKRREQEEAEWAARSGPVTIRKKGSDDC